jgi:hypothetical protein
MKQDRDANFIAKNATGSTVNRWLTTGMLAASASSSETSYLTWKVVRSLGMVVFDNQARVCCLEKGRRQSQALAFASSRAFSKSEEKRRI